MLDAELRYVQVNEQLAAINGRLPEAHLGLPFAQVSEPLAAELLPVLNKILADGEAVTGLEQGKVILRTNRLRVHADDTQDGVLIVVKDNGIGIPADSLSDIFEAFTQLKQNATHHGGLGIGLTLVKQLTELHGGSVEVCSEGANRGSEFAITLPIVKPPAATDNVPAQSVVKPGLRVLIVDDNIDAAVGLALLLESECGCQVETAYTATTGLAAALARPPAVAILDLGLPDISGLDLAQSMRQDARLAETTLIALTGFGDQQTRKRALAAGFDYHLTKPVTLAVLVEQLAAGR